MDSLGRPGSAGRGCGRDSAFLTRSWATSKPRAREPQPELEPGEDAENGSRGRIVARAAGSADGSGPPPCVGRGGCADVQRARGFGAPHGEKPRCKVVWPNPSHMDSDPGGKALAPGHGTLSHGLVGGQPRTLEKRKKEKTRRKLHCVETRTDATRWRGTQQGCRRLLFPGTATCIPSSCP